MNTASVEGTLYKWTNYAMGWKSRFFVLRGNIMYYYLAKGEKVRGKIHLNVAEVIPVEQNPFKFQIDTGTTMVYLYAKEENEKAMWVDALQAVKNKEQNQIDSKPAPIIKQQNLPTFEVNSDNKLLKKILTTKSLLEDLSKNNNVLSEIIKNNEINQFNLNEICSKYKVSILMVFSNFDEVGVVLNNFANDFYRFKDYLEGAEDFKKIYSVKDNRARNTINNSNMIQNTSNTNNMSPAFNEMQNKHRGSENSNKIQIVNSQINEFFYGMEEFSGYTIQKEKNNENTPITPVYSNMNVNKSNKFYSEYYVNKRTKFPCNRTMIKFNLWTIVKDAIGKDLNRFTMPVYLNEPLSMLQRCCESFQYAGLLNRAANDPNPHIRLASCAAFCV